jgi:hypothetical protein
VVTPKPALLALSFAVAGCGVAPPANDAPPMFTSRPGEGTGRRPYRIPATAVGENARCDTYALNREDRQVVCAPGLICVGVEQVGFGQNAHLDGFCAVPKTAQAGEECNVNRDDDPDTGFLCAPGLRCIVQNPNSPDSGKCR